jgi:hypothetical protein
VPEKGPGLGNFGIVHVNPQEIWVTTSEWMKPGMEQYDSNNHVYVARIIWNQPNECWL